MMDIRESSAESYAMSLAGTAEKCTPSRVEEFAKVGYAAAMHAIEGLSRQGLLRRLTDTVKYERTAAGEAYWKERFGA